MRKPIAFILVIAVMAGMLAFTASADGSPFSDVSESRWSYEAIRYAYNRQYMKGTGENRFSPDGTMTRAMVVTVLHRMEETPEPETAGGFSDVKAGSYYEAAVAWAKENGIVKGVSATRFDPDGKITREQLAAILFRFSDHKGYDVFTPGSLDRFPDAESASGYSREALLWATAKGLISGIKKDGGDILSPRGSATREQFAAILQRFDSTFPVRYADPVLRSGYVEKEYPLVNDADVYVAEDGDDNASGDFDHPVATFSRAVELVRGLKATVTGRSVKVAFRAGTYFTENVTMTEADSGTKDFPVIYCAYGDGEVVITGGATINEEDFEPVGEDEKYMFEPKYVDKIRKTYISEKLPGYTTKDVLFGEDGVKWTARYPNKYADSTDNLLSGSGYASSENHIRILHGMLQKRVAKYHTLNGLQLFGYLTTGWYKDILDTDGYTVDEETGGFDFYIPHPETARMQSLRYNEFPWWEYFAVAFINVSEELNDNGEYWVDPDTLTLYVYNPQGRYSFPTADRGVKMADCDYVTFRGLTMTSYRVNIIKTDRCSGITLDRCNFSVCSGEIGVDFFYPHGNTDFDITVTGCDFSVFAGKAFNANGGCGMKNRFDRRGNIVFDNNRVSNACLVIDEGGAVHLNNYNEALVTHNEFVHNSRCCLVYSGCNMTAEYNLFDDYMFNSSDGGAVYCYNTQCDWNNVIRYCVFSPASWFAFYIDDTEPGTEICFNLLIDSTVCIHNGRSTNVHDNIFVHSGVDLAMGDIRATLEEYAETGDVSVITRNSFYKNWMSFLNALDADPALKEAYVSRYPEIATLKTDPALADDPFFILYPRNEIRNNLYIQKEIDPFEGDGYSVVEGNDYRLMTENPCFVNPSAGDYTVVAGSGCPDIRFELVGRY